MVRSAHSTEPHKMYILSQCLFNLSAAIDIIDISKYEHFEQHSGMKTAGTANFIGSNKGHNIYLIQNLVCHTNRVIGRNEFIKRGRKQHCLLLIISFIPESSLADFSNDGH